MLFSTPLLFLDLWLLTVLGKAFPPVGRGGGREGRGGGGREGGEGRGGGGGEGGRERVNPDVEGACPCCLASSTRTSICLCLT